jgi:uncharacterized phage protein (TIGR01671 family)
MTREILFRGKKTVTSQWVEGSLICDKYGLPYAICQQNYNPVSDGVLSGWVFGVLPKSVGQFTGLLDKNGKKIFEGDIISNNEDKIYFVEYIDDSCNYVLTNGKGYDSRNCQDLNCDSIFYSAVIGNIHDNPELIRKEGNDE